jgi:3-phytase
MEEAAGRPPRSKSFPSNTFSAMARITKNPEKRYAIDSSLPAFLGTCGFAAILVCLSLQNARGGDTVRVATFNLALYGNTAGEVRARLQDGNDPQARHLAEIIQRVRPDVLLLNEIDYDEQGEILRLFCENYLSKGQNVSNSPDGPAEPIEFPHRRSFPSNTGRHAGIDLDRNGAVDPQPGAEAYAGDCWGYGRYEGQYAFALLSRFPFDDSAARSFRMFLWKDLPGRHLPDDPATTAPDDWYSAEALARFPLSSKNHCDAPILVGGRRIHLLLSHPTPPVYDGPEDRNGLRNRDELAFWRLYVEGRAQGSGVRCEGGGNSHSETNSAASRGVPAPGVSTVPAPGESAESPFVDDAGRRGGLPEGESFVIVGDLNGDSLDGDGVEGISQLLSSSAVLQYPAPQSAGGLEQAKLQGGANDRHRGDPRSDTCDPPDDPGPGNLRLDYVLPSNDLKVAKSGVFWPATDDPLFPLVAGTQHPASSDHRLVWADLIIEAAEPSEPVR